MGDAAPAKLRIAPTPSGLLHVGNAYNFVLTALWARHLGATLALRIDDGDRGRVRKEYLHDIFQSLDWLGLVWQEGPEGVTDFKKNYSQQHRQDAYRAALQRLQSGGYAYACSCSRAQIRALRDDGIYPGTCREAFRQVAPAPFAIRAALDETAEKVTLPSWASDHPEEVALRAVMGDFVLLRKDGLAAYQLASLVDDEAMGTTHLVRGIDLVSSSAAQSWLADKLDLPRFQRVQFLHHPLVRDEQGQKLSKSEGAIALRSWRQAGTTAATLYQQCAQWLLGASVSVSNFDELYEAWAEHNARIKKEDS